MSKLYQDEIPGYGKGSLYSEDLRNIGHVALFVQFVPEPGFYAVDWRSNSRSSTDEAREMVEKAVREYLHTYLRKRSQYGLRVTIVDVVSDVARQNNYERAVNLAFHSALEEIGLPVPQIFGL